MADKRDVELYHDGGLMVLRDCNGKCMNKNQKEMKLKGSFAVFNLHKCVHHLYKKKNSTLICINRKKHQMTIFKQIPNSA